MNSKVSQSIYKWITALDIKVSSNYLTDLLHSHPEYPSLVSITDTLDELGISNISLVVDKDKLHELPVPFITHITKNGGEFLVVKNIEQQIKQDKKFEKSWNGIVVLAEKSEDWSNSGNEKYLANEKSLRYQIYFAVIAIILTAGLSLFTQFSFLLAGLLLATLSGLGISILIVQQELGISNEITDQLCNAGTNTNCNTVINSEGSKFSKWLNWADAGIIYFASFFILMVTTINIPILSVLFITTIPFIFFSLYYQWQIVKKWCTLCLLILSVLILQFAFLTPFIQSLFNEAISSYFNIGNISITVFVFLSIAVTWLLILKPELKKNKELSDNNNSLLRFKNNQEIFKALLIKQKKITNYPFGLGITLGNPLATNTIIKVCNPNCLPCAKAHIIIDEIIKNNPEVKVQIIFMVADDVNDKSKTVKHFMAIYEKNDIELMKEALDYWYTSVNKNYNDFSQKYVLNGELEKQGAKLNSMKKWCDETNISFTPTFFLNGYQLPKTYNIGDVKRSLNI